MVQTDVNLRKVFKNKLRKETSRRSTPVSASAQAVNEDGEHAIPGRLRPQMNNQGFYAEDAWIIRLSEGILN